MAVRDEKMLASDYATWKCITMVLPATATSQTDLEVDSSIPGFNFEIARVEGYCMDQTDTVTVNVKIGSTTALASALTLTDDAVAAATLSTTLSARRGSSTDAINLEYTSDGSGEIVAGKVRVWVRPYPLSGEALPSAGL